MLRSNYFAVKDEPSFRYFCRRWGLQPIENHQGLHGFYQTDLGNELEDEILISSYGYGAFEEELANLLAYENVAVLMEIDHDKMRYFTGSALAINSRHESKRIDLSDIYELAEGLGEFMTAAEY